MIVIEMDDDNYIMRVYDRGTGKDVDYAISYCVDDTEEPTYIIPTNKMHKCSTNIFAGRRALIEAGFDISKVKHKKGVMDGIDWAKLKLGVEEE
jgi:hypothetical protein